MLPVQREWRTREGGAARESKNETREKGTVRSRRNAGEKRGDLLRQNGSHLPAAAGKSMPMPAVRGGIQKQKGENLP
jgi:hypothetical protein